jgi:glycerol-3-phosphate acyltransferase PlsX
MLKIALDAMGGDKAPSEIVRGAVMAVERSNGRFSVVLTGPEATVRRELEQCGYSEQLIEVIDAPQLVAMDESPANVVKHMPESSLVKCVALQKEGAVQASISAGNSGAMMAASMMILGRIPGVNRPAISCLIPTNKQKTVVLDCGANVDEKPQYLVDWAICGAVYAEKVLGRNNPTVGLLNIGEEAKKGPELERTVYQLLQSSPVNFIGNVEPREFIQGAVDVLVTGGFSGNLLLKFVESFYTLHLQQFGFIDTPQGRAFEEEWNYDNHGGALLIGLHGTGVIAHGRAEAKAIAAAIDAAWNFAHHQVSRRIEERLAPLQEGNS